MTSRRDAEAGTTLTEVLVVLAITSMLVTPLVAVVGAAFRVQDSRAAEDQARIELAVALAAMTDDLRTGVPVATRPSGTRAADTVGVRVTDSADVATVVYWSVGPRGLRRVEADPTTGRIQDQAILNPNITEPDVAGSGDPTFRYFDASGRELDPATIGLERLTECTTLVEVRLEVPVEGEAADRVVAESIRHAVRGRDAGGNGC